MTEVRILSVSTALPGPTIDNATLSRRFNMPSAFEQWIDTFVGTHHRHFAVDLDTGEIRSTLADLAAEAGAKAMADAGTSADDIDVIVMGTSSPDALIPATVNVVADRLGIDGIPTYQMQSGCAGAIQAMDVAIELLRSGRYSTALVLGGDTCAKHLDVEMDASRLVPEEQINGVLFGDGAGAMVLSTRPSTAAGSVTVRHAFVQLVGRGRAPGQVVNWSGRARRAADGPTVAEDYKAIEASVPPLAADALTQVLEALDWSGADVDYLLPPQLSGRMTERITQHLDLPSAHEISCVVDIGNTGNALPFFQLELALPRMVEGDRAVGLAIESSKWIKAGFAVEKV